MKIFVGVAGGRGWGGQVSTHTPCSGLEMRNRGVRCGSEYNDQLVCCRTACKAELDAIARTKVRVLISAEDQMRCKNAPAPFASFYRPDQLKLEPGSI